MQGIETVFAYFVLSQEATKSKSERDFARGKEGGWMMKEKDREKMIERKRREQICDN